MNIKYNVIDDDKSYSFFIGKKVTFYICLNYYYMMFFFMVFDGCVFERNSDGLETLKYEHNAIIFFFFFKPFY